MAKQAKMVKICVTAGSHRLSERRGEDSNGNPLIVGVNVKQGECFMGSPKLVKRFPEKFRLVDINDGTNIPVVSIPDDEDGDDGSDVEIDLATNNESNFDTTDRASMASQMNMATVPVLVAYAKQHEIALASNARKDEIVQTILTATFDEEEAEDGEVDVDA